MNTTGSNISSEPSRHNRVMAMMLPTLLVAYVAIPLAAARK